MRFLTILTGAVLAIGLAAPALAQSADVEAGKKVFNKCRACHAIGPGATNKVGPELNGVVAEPFATAEGYSFSPALRQVAEANPAWTPELLTQWLTDPKKLVPGTKMAFPGLKKPEDIANVLAYLGSFDEAGAPK